MDSPNSAGLTNVAVDMMGGDRGVDANVRGVFEYISKNGVDGVCFHLFGDASRIESAAKGLGGFKTEHVEIHDTGVRVISPDEQPSHAVRHGKGTSMFEAVSHTALGKSDAVISSGNTGAYMALSKTIIGMIGDMIRPAIVGVIPNSSGKSIMLDLGANTSCSAIQLVQFAVMGLAFARVLLGVENPTVGLLNIGTEKSKGTEVLCSAYSSLRSMKDISFAGFIEGTDILQGTTDVIVSDGFSGNIALKTIEGTVKYMAHLVKSEFCKSILCKVGYLFSRRSISSIRDVLDPRNHNGAPFVGLRKIVIKSHGGSDHIGFANAISVAVGLAKSNFISNITSAIESIEEKEKA
jgi:glycerol-3-phosphate acyltransferase PlsX